MMMMMMKKLGYAVLTVIAIPAVLMATSAAYIVLVMVPLYFLTPVVGAPIAMAVMFVVILVLGHAQAQARKREGRQ